MKQTYQKPSIKVRHIVVESMLAAISGESGISIGGNTDITVGTGETPTKADGKHNLFDNDIWNEE